MKLRELREMTMNISDQSDKQVKSYFDFLSQDGKHVGDQDGLPVVKATVGSDIFYGIMDNNQLVSICTLRRTMDNDILILHIAHTLTQFRGKSHIFKLLWFIKNQEGKSLLDYGAQTSDGIKLVKALSKTKRFNISWVNPKTKEKIPYNPVIDSPDNSPYRSHASKTDWRILIERDSEPSFPRYDDNFVKGIISLFD